ncbi:hypothetical protein JMUB5695_01684 [Mycobacterium heckeshornense]|uniref:amino acid aminotransferase n=1 Tax=Mycobacterium heckeshornense TaxID=110505 RepID=UPI0019408BA0|nr:amino acid aminotransferase [Mycobacterium heckeshornense]BCQ08259.1 hypothetical protein JMUB5695_01684 [Mycobacterium heckeshornense]
MHIHTADPPDPARAALDVVIRTPAMLAESPALLAALRGYAALLDAADAFRGLSWFDARHVALAAAFDRFVHANAAEFLRFRAARAETGGDGMRWDDPAAVSRAFHIAAEVLDR